MVMVPCTSLPCTYYLPLGCSRAGALGALLHASNLEVQYNFTVQVPNPSLHSVKLCTYDHQLGKSCKEKQKTYTNC